MAVMESREWVPSEEQLTSILPLEEGERVHLAYKSTKKNASVPQTRVDYLVVEVDETDGYTAKVWLNPEECRRDDAEIRASASMVYSRFFEREENMQRRVIGYFPRFTRVEAEGE